MSTLKTTYINNPDNGGTSNVELEESGNITVGGGINATGVVTATSFTGDGSGLTGVASTDNIITGTAVTFNNTVDIGSNTGIGLSIYKHSSGSSRIDNISGATYIRTGVGGGAPQPMYFQMGTDGNVDNVAIFSTVGASFYVDGSEKFDANANGVAVHGSIASAGVGTVTYDVRVVTKNSTHRYYNQGSSSGYRLDGLHAPFLQLNPGGIYRFDQSHSSNSGHPLLFYYDAEKTTQYTSNVTTSGTPGTDGYTEITVTDTTPSVLHYQCSAHALMGNAVNTNSKVAGGADLYGMLKEEVNVTAGKLSDNTNIDVEKGMVHLFTTTETATSTPNIRYNASTSLDSVMNIGESVTVTILTTAAAAAYSADITIDGSTVTENWIGGSAPSSGGTSGIDIHTFNIIKTNSATFTVIGNHTKTS